MISFKHKWTFYALSILLASLAAHESIGLLLLIFILDIFLLYKKVSKFHIVFLPIIGLVVYLYFSTVLNELKEPIELPTRLTWTDDYKIKENTLRGFMKDDRGRKVYVVYKIPTDSEKLTLQQISLVGTVYWINGTLEKTSKPNHNYSFNMEKYLKSKGATGIVEITNWKFLKKESSLLQKLGDQRFKLKQHIQETFPESLVGEAQALLIGLQENVDEEITRAYQKLGITHLFAISGLHIEIVSFIVFQGMLRLRMRRELASIILMALLPIYAILAGGAPSVWRAVTVVELIMIGKLKGKLFVDDALALSFILFVFIQPWSIYQIGFQLSYLATASLIYSSNLLQRSPSWIIQSFLITFVCQLLVYPFLLFHFYEISISSFITNIIFVPLFSFIILPINIGLLFISFLPSQIVNYLFLCYEPLRGLLSNFINLLQSIPYQMWNPGKPAFFMILVSYISVFVVFYLLDIKEKWWKIIIILCIPVLILQFQGKFHNDLKMSFINVGQGDCILIELPHRNGVYLIDTGGLLRFKQENKENNPSYEIGRDIVVPYLKGKGINKIDKLILTHADADHVEGAEEVVQEIQVEEIHISPNSYKKEVMSDLIREAKKQNIPIKEQMANYSWKVADIQFTYLWPNDLDYEGNNDSLVLYITFGEFNALLTGDLEEAGELSLLKFYPSLPQIDVLKAGHHGSKTSSSEAFLERLQPNLTIFSAGQDNLYGHPHQEIIERYGNFGLATLTTSEVGTIELMIQDGKFDIKTSFDK